MEGRCTVMLVVALWNVDGTSSRVLLLQWSRNPQVDAGEPKLASSKRRRQVAPRPSVQIAGPGARRRAVHHQRTKPRVRRPLDVLTQPVLARQSRQRNGAIRLKRLKHRAQLYANSPQATNTNIAAAYHVRIP